MLIYETHEHEEWQLTAEGAEIAQHGSHEVAVFQAIPSGPEGIPLSELQVNFKWFMGNSTFLRIKTGRLLKTYRCPQSKWSNANILKIGQGKAFKNKWVKKDGDRLVRLVESVQDQTQVDLLQILQTKTHTDAEVLKELKKRKLCDKV